ncbi:MAG: tetratricopeptide repeat protein [Pyrinomonadaceae bacterium]|nr:tetratricopeptide repeat protein [Pyrinomonadaceae bacterium]
MQFVRKILSIGVVFFAFTVNGFAVEKWTEVNSENFHLVGNAAPGEIDQTAVKLEQFRAVFTKIFKQYNFISPIPTTVLVFKDENSFLKFKPLDANGQPKDFVKGYFLPGTDLNYIALSAEANKLNDFTTIYHEYVHFLINNTLGKNNIPPWLNEGFAEYYEQFKLDADGKIILGAVNAEHLAILKKNGLMPLDNFFAVDYYTLQRQPKENMIRFYAQAWALIHFFTHNAKGAAKSDLDNFAKLLTIGIPEKQAFRQAFRLNNDELEKELKKYIEGKSFDSVLIADIDRSISNRLKIREIPEAEALTYLGDLMLHANRIDEAEKLLTEALKLNPELSFANTSMGFLKIKLKDSNEARKYLEKGVANDSGNFYAQFGYAYLLSREGMSDFGFIISYSPATADKMRLSLRRAIELNPGYAESYHLYAFVNYVQNQNLDEGLEMIDKALRIAPGNQWFQIRKAELLMKKNEFAAARLIAQKIIGNAADDQLKLYSINTLNLINNWEAQLESAKNLDKKRENPAVTEKPLSEEEILRLNQIAMRESLIEALRKPQPHEQRLIGFLEKAVCESNEVIFSFKNKEKIYKIRSNSFTDVIFISFTPNGAGKQFGCNSQKVEQFAVITYRPAKNAVSNLLGEAISIEFVPENFTLPETNPKF